MPEIFFRNIRVKTQHFHLQAFAALQYIVSRQLFIKAVLAYARADFSPSGGSIDSVFSNEMFSGRVRLMYLY